MAQAPPARSGDQARVQGCGKSAPAASRGAGSVNPGREQGPGTTVGRLPRPDFCVPLEAVGNGGPRQMITLRGCLRAAAENRTRLTSCFPSPAAGPAGHVLPPPGCGSVLSPTGRCRRPRPGPLLSPSGPAGGRAQHRRPEREFESALPPGGPVAISASDPSGSSATAGCRPG
jgi:hypothetical protein